LSSLCWILNDVLLVFESFFWHIVIGIKDNITRKKLLQDHNLTLKKWIDICRANETTTEQLKKIRNKDVQYVRKKTQKPTKHHAVLISFSFVLSPDAIS
jgi:hypothetical protein